MDATIWPETYGNGALIIMIKTTTTYLQEKIRQGRRLGSKGLSGAAGFSILDTMRDVLHVTVYHGMRRVLRSVSVALNPLKKDKNSF